MYRRTDEDTAQGAAVIAIGNAATNRHLALVHLYAAGDDGLSDFDLEAKTGVQQTSIGKRRGELRDAGLVARAFDEAGKGRTRLSPSNTPAAVWVITDAGRRFLQRCEDEAS